MCEYCKYCECIYDGYSFCTKNKTKVMVVRDYEPTENYNYCQREEMMYKTPRQMSEDGWCYDCIEDVNKCMKQKECEGYKRYYEDIN